MFTCPSDTAAQETKNQGTSITATSGLAPGLPRPLSRRNIFLTVLRSSSAGFPLQLQAENIDLFTDTGLVTDVPDSLVCHRSLPDRKGSNLPVHRQLQRRASVYDLMDSWSIDQMPTPLGVICPHRLLPPGGHSHRVPRSRNQKFHHQKATERTTKKIDLGRGFGG